MIVGLLLGSVRISPWRDATNGKQAAMTAHRQIYILKAEWIIQKNGMRKKRNGFAELRI